MPDPSDALAGVILGTAVGDALGLPYENLSPRRARRLFGPPPLRHRFLFGRGMVSDDTEHTCLVGRALLHNCDDADRFLRSLAWGLRRWLLGAPAGVGRATLRACLKLWLGFPPSRSGVWSAGNGPAMRTALLGVYLGDDPDRLRAFVRASTRLTHTDPRAEHGAYLVARAAHFGATRGPDGVRPGEFLQAVRSGPTAFDPELNGVLDRLAQHLARGADPAEFAAALGLGRGVSGYVYHTVPTALYCWLRSPGDFRRAVEDVILLGGDADTTAAITGALAGATAGISAIPVEWLSGLAEWPLSAEWMRELAGRLAAPDSAGKAPSLFWPGILPRNAFFFLVVLGHVARRLLPPY